MFQNPDIAASNFVKGVDTAFVVIFAVAFFFLISITATMIYFVFRYNKKRNPIATQIKGSTTLEIIWTVVPIIIVLGLFYVGWAGWHPMTKVPKDAFTITAEARMWQFSFIYPDGKREKNLIVPQGQPVRLKLKSLDVIHSLYIPSFRVKEDMVPGNEKEMWFIPQKLGDFDVFCAEYCGLNHSYMLSTVKVLSDSAFQSWYVDTTKVVQTTVESPSMAGYNLMQETGCFACHSINGSKLVGPSYKGIWGEKVLVKTAKGNKEVTVDAEYIKRSVYDPNAEVVVGYNTGLMLSYKDQLSDKDIELIVEYLKTLSHN